MLRLLECFYFFLVNYFQGGESSAVSEKANSIASAGSGFCRKNFSRSGPSSRRFDGNDGTSKSSTRGNFSANQRKQQPENEDNAAGDYAASVSVIY